MNSSPTLRALADFQEKIKLYESIGGILTWDQNCQMPSLGSSYRGKQLGFLSQTHHELNTSTEYAELLDKAEAETAGLEEDHYIKLNIKKTRQQIERIQKVPARLVQELTEAAVESQSAWEKAREQDSFELFYPAFVRMLDLTKEKAACYHTPTPYDALIPDYELGIDTALLDGVFAVLRNELMVILAKIQDAKAQAAPRALGRHVGTEDQQRLGHELAKTLGFDFDDGVIYVSSHPFSCTLGPSDYRITTRYHEDNFVSSFTSVAHEVGHSLYERGLPNEYFSMPIGQPASMGVHESQSLFWEKRIVSSREFLSGWLTRFNGGLGTLPRDLSLDELTASFNQVVPGLIRIDADEVTYCLHIMVRFEIEKMLLNDNLNPSDIPAVWNEKYKQYLGVTPPNNTLGCLQDIHWACGNFGYFPSYALGHLMSAQLTKAMERDIGSISTPIQQERFDIIRSWLTTHVYHLGARHNAQELMMKVTGEPISAAPFISYLYQKYQPIYRF